MSTISTSGISPSSVIRAEHVLRIINALSNVSTNDILITGSLTVTGSTALSGSLNVTGGITGSLLGTASNSISSSYALTASYAVSASYEISYEVSSSYAESATSASYALSSSYALNSTSASYSLSSSYALNSTNATNATSASYSLDATNAATATSASYALDSTNSSAATSASYALTASYALNSPGGGGTTDTGSLLLTASVTDNVITFTKGDASTFNITIDTGSASSINTGSFATTGSNTFTGNQIVNANLTLTSSATMSILSTGGSTGMVITRDQVSINPNLNSDRAQLYGGTLQLSAVNGYSGLYLTNRNGSSDTSSIEIHRIQFQGKETDANFGLKAGLRVFQSVGTGSSGYINFYTSASSAFGFTSGDLDMRISTGSKIELFRDTTVTGSVSITSVLTLEPNNPLPSAQPTGSISVSGSGADCKPYFYNGTDWTSMI